MLCKERSLDLILYHSFYFILFTVYLCLFNLCQSVHLIADITYIYSSFLNQIIFQKL